MSTQDPKTGDEKKKTAGKASQPVRLKSAGKGKAVYKEAFDESPEEKHIHARRPLPPVPEAPAEDSEQSH
jgi:hypothetical protein